MERVAVAKMATEVGYRCCEVRSVEVVVVDIIGAGMVVFTCSDVVVVL